MRWLSNIGNPNQELPMQLFGESLQQAFARRDSWLADKIIGRPKATEHYTVEQLEAWGMVGVYVVDENTAEVAAE